ncbi:hypothetical protein SZ54_2789 [Rhizobium sp. UR51a]|nr:hypothetical protein SZ54_2789 [Rhizobium sp. UR51a]
MFSKVWNMGIFRELTWRKLFVGTIKSLARNDNATRTKPVSRHK